MKLISDFSDYYDNTIAYGIDEKVVFLRKQKKLYVNKLRASNEELKENEDFYKHIEIFNKYKESHLNYKETQKYKLRAITKEMSNDGFEYHFTSGSLGFCGFCIPYIESIKSKALEKYGEERIILETNYFYNVEEYKEFLEEKIKEGKYKNWKGTKTKSQKIEDLIQTFKWLLKTNRQEKFISGLFEILKSPIINYKEGIVIINDNLKKLKFSKVKDSFTTFQDISMYMACLNVNEDEIKPKDFDDKVIAQSKGFDCHSFKKVGKNSKDCKKK